MKPAREGRRPVGWQYPIRIWNVDTLSCRGEPQGTISAPMFACRLAIERCGSRLTGGPENALPRRQRIVSLGRAGGRLRQDLPP